MANSIWVRWYCTGGNGASFNTMIKWSLKFTNHSVHITKAKQNREHILWVLYCACYSNGFRADSKFALSQWETALLCNEVSRWLGANLESDLGFYFMGTHIFTFSDTTMPFRLAVVKISLQIWFIYTHVHIYIYIYIYIYILFVDFLNV